MSEAASPKSSPKPSKYDLIIIGTGMGALTTASLLTQFKNKKILMIERLGKTGGFTHSFSREKKYSFDAGIHYVGDMGSQSPLRRLMNKITGDKVGWNFFKDPFQIFVYPDFQIPMRSQKGQYKAELFESFPDERDKIDQYFLDLRKARSWGFRSFMLGKLPRLLREPLRTWNSSLEALATQTTETYFNSRGFSKKLSAVLDSQWGDYGEPSHRSLFMVHAMVVSHYLKGAYFPEGGGQRISDSALQMVKAGGGEVLLKTKATAILLDEKKQKVIGVQVEDLLDGTLTQLMAPIVVSNAGAANTYLQLLPGKLFPFENELREMSQKGYCCLNLYLGLSESPQSLGIQGENYWLYGSFDHSQNEAETLDLLTSQKLGVAFVSFGSLNNSEAKHSTAQMICPISPELFSKWRNTQIKNRGDDYLKLKNQLTQVMIKRLELQFPGLGTLISFSELGTPLTFEHYGGQVRGAVYGIPWTKDNIRAPWRNPKSPIQGLFLTGADVVGGGIAGAMMGGLLCACEIGGYQLLFKAFSPSKGVVSKK